MWDYLPGDRAFDSATFGVAGTDQPGTGLVECVRAEAELLHLCGEFCGELGVAERYPCLVCKIGEQLLVPRTQRVAGGHLHADVA